MYLCICELGAVVAGQPYSGQAAALPQPTSLLLTLCKSTPVHVCTSATVLSGVRSLQQQVSRLQYLGFEGSECCYSKLHAGCCGTHHTRLRPPELVASLVPSLEMSMRRRPLGDHLSSARRMPVAASKTRALWSQLQLTTKLKAGRGH